MTYLLIFTVLNGPIKEVTIPSFVTENGCYQAGEILLDVYQGSYQCIEEGRV